MLSNLKRAIVSRVPLTPTGFAVAAGLALVLVAVLIFLVATWRHERRAAAEAKVEAAMGEARGRSASEAGAIIDRAHDFSTDSETLSRENADAIRQAPGADQRLDPALNDAGRRRVCQRPGLRRTAECVQLLGPAEPSR